MMTDHYWFLLLVLWGRQWCINKVKGNQCSYQEFALGSPKPFLTTTWCLCLNSRSIIKTLSTWHQDHNQTGILRFFIESTCTIFWYKVKRRNYTFKETECKYFHFVGRCVIIPSLFLRHWKQLTYMYLGTFLAILVTLFPFTHYGNQNGPSLEPWPNSFPITFNFFKARRSLLAILQLQYVDC